ncbi:mannonate dehydratase [Nitratireductor alexandrii]|uniref:mannonate dehydratase n=1 Tax=Nitratireductor alexandrii TaxID=2448161 RepID=UPI000FDBAE6A|nr:mannonate dehydratase [Nitratireductor alexandrii]
MRQAWRWFGPRDKVSLADARQAGASCVVTALHHVPAGAIWHAEEIEARQREVAFHPDGSMTHLAWEVVESLPVSEAIKTQTGDWRADLVHYKRSLENLARAGIETICYNFMPVLDWTRTELAWPLGHGGTAMRFDLADFAAFDIHVLKRRHASADYEAPILETAKERFDALDEAGKKRLAANITAGLPGAAEHWSLEGLSRQLALYAGIDAARLRQNLIDFLSEVVPLAQRLGLRLCCHPDDPPFALLGLPRVMSTEEDYRAVLDAVDLSANGVTFCTGSLGVRPDNDLPAMAARLGPRIHFVHLRNVRRDAETVPCSFFEDEHLAGQTDMVAVVAALLAEESRRRKEGRADAEIPMRPDHGQEILDDLTRGAQPGYPAIGRLKGLAELRGVMAVLGRHRQRI